MQINASALNTAAINADAAASGVAAGAASGFAAGGFGAPVLRITQPAFLGTEAATYFFPKNMVSSGFSDGLMTSDYPDHNAVAWAATNGEISAGTFGIPIDTWAPVHIDTTFSGMAVSGYYELNATLITSPLIAPNTNRSFTFSARELIGGSIRDSPTIQYNHAAVGNHSVFVRGGTLEGARNFAAPVFDVGSSHTLRFTCSPTLANTYIDGALVDSAAVDAANTAPLDVIFNVMGFRLDSISLADAHADSFVVPAADGPMSRFGTPKIPSHDAAGFLSAGSGAAVATQAHPAQTLGAITQFGTPASPSHQTAQASGFTTSRFGAVLATRFMPSNLSRTGQAFGFSSGQLGAPAAGWLQTGYASGVHSAVVGSPGATRMHHPVGFSSTLFGAPTAGLTQRASGSKTTNFGAPTAGMQMQATGSPPSTRLGLPATSRSNTFAAYGINASGRLGQPRGFIRFNHYATGFASGAAGTPLCAQRHRVAPASPGSRFGKALLRRNTTC